MMMTEKSSPAPTSAVHASASSSSFSPFSSAAPIGLSQVSASASASTSSSAAPRRGKLLRRSNSDRLRMHAPSSIQVDASAAAAAASEWKVAIPLLSPLDCLDFASPWLPHLDEPPAMGIPPKDQHQQTPPEARGAADRVVLRHTKPWQHPAAPFYYDPPVSTANAAPLLLPQPQGA